eukprot:Seg3853.1 transcript_id=Seg3853.1/GoldUCD/mRNA.D3Y31 product="hypothetical protein" protein_id=Seg3853.1/GoldUCD/D3Y31
MKILFILLFGLALVSQGEASKFEDEDEPSGDSRRIEDIYIEKHDQNHNENHVAEMRDTGEADPAKKPVNKKPATKKKPAIMKKPFKIPGLEEILPDKCPANYRFCRSKTTCVSFGLYKTVCIAKRLCFCSMCPKNTKRVCGFLKHKTMNSSPYTLVCKCRPKQTAKPKHKPKPKRKPKLETS